MNDDLHDLVGRIRAAADRLASADDDLGERAAVARELQACAAVLQGQLADLQPPVPPSDAGPASAHGRSAPSRGDRIVDLGERQLPVRVFVGEPLEFLGLRVDATGEPEHTSVGVELHNPSQTTYRAHGKLLFQDAQGERVERSEFAIDAIDPLETVTQPEPVELPDRAAAISVVVTVDLAD